MRTKLTMSLIFVVALCFATLMFPLGTSAGEEPMRVRAATTTTVVAQQQIVSTLGFREIEKELEIYQALRYIADVRAIMEAVAAQHARQVAEEAARAKRVQKTNAAPRSKPVATGSGGSSVWDRLAACESGGNWSIATGNGFYGGLQFTLSSWRAVGGTGMPNQASRETQIAMAERLLASQGWGAWPACSRKLGLR